MTTHRFKRKLQSSKERTAKEYEDHLSREWQQTEAQRAKAPYEMRLERIKPHEGLRKLRLRKNMTQDEMASVCGIATRSYQNYESGRQAIPSTVTKKLAAEYLVDIHELFTGGPHANSFQIQAETVLFTGEIIGYLETKFSDMLIDEKSYIALEFIEKNRLGSVIDMDNLFESIRIVTGDKYLTYELLNAGKMTADYEDIASDET